MPLADEKRRFLPASFPRFRLGLAGAVLLLCSAVYLRERDHIETVQLAAEKSQVSATARLFTYELRPVADDLRQLASGEALHTYLDHGQPADLEQAIQRAAAYSRLKPAFDQVRFIDEHGNELIRVNQGGRIVAPHELQNKAGRAYFERAVTLAPDRIYLSAFDLNVEQGRIEQPLKPMLRLATPVFDATHRCRGVYVINYLAAERFDSLQELRAENGHRLRMLNARGYWLKAAQNEQEWGFMFPGRKTQTLAQSDPALWARMRHEPSGQVRNAGGLFTWQHLDLQAGLALDPRTIVPEDNYLIVASEITPSELSGLLTRTRWVVGTFALILVVGAWLVGRLLNARHQTNRALRRSEENLNVTLNSIGEAVLSTDGLGRITRMNPLAESLTGWSLADAKGRPIETVFQILDGQTREPLTVPVDVVLTTGEKPACRPDTHLVSRDGSEHPIDGNAAPIRSRRGRIIGVVLVFRDVTAKRTAQRGMEALRQELQDITEALDQHAMVSILDFHGQILKANDKLCEITQYSRDELIGQPWSRLESTHHSIAFFQERWETIRQGKIWQNEICQQAKDGSRFWMETTIVPFLDADGMLFQYVTIGTDITERKQAEADLAVANEELGKASRLKDEFLANMSHELRTPLNAILGLSETLLEQMFGPLTRRQNKSLRTISSSGKHLLALINDILDLSKIEAGHLELNTEPLQLREFCETCLLLVRTQAVQKQIAISFEPEVPTDSFVADARRFKQILVNLLTNAVKFTPAGGAVGLTVRQTAEPAALAFTVWDSGIGIAAEDQPKLFQSFTQIDSGLSRNQEGTGLGLALVAKLTALHGGRVSLESAPGQGSRFCVTLPHEVALPIPPPARHSSAHRLVESESIAPEREPHHALPTLLLAEDNAPNRETLGGYLEAKGYTVHYAETGLEAIEVARAIRPDLILMDIQMPVMDGLTAIGKIRVDEALGDTPIIALTALVMPGDRELCLVTGANAYLSKPVSLRQLVAMVEQYARPVGDGENAALSAPPSPSLRSSAQIA